MSTRAERLIDSCRREWGEAATVNGTAVTGVFTSQHVLVQDLGSEAPVSHLVTALTIRDDDVAAAVGQTVVVRGQSYTIADVQRDNRATAVLILQAA